MTKSMARTLLLFLLIVAVSVAVAAAHYALRGGNFADLGKGAAELVQPTAAPLTAAPLQTPAPAAVAPAPKASGIEVYFAPGQPGAAGIDSAFLHYLQSARTSIYGAFYDFQWVDAARVLVEKRRQGVDVRVVSDSDYAHREAVAICLQGGVQVIFDDRSALMHDKFCIVDAQSVWTGSTNCTENCLYRNNNNSIRIDSKPLAANYTAEFDEMFTQGQFGKRSPRGTPYPQMTVEAVDLECYFAPEDDVYGQIEQEIHEAVVTIDFMAFSFTSQDLADAMAARMREGVRVRGLFDTQQAASRYSQDEYLAGRGAAIWLDGNPHVMHHKVIVIDGQTVVTGSYNFSKSAEEKNDENVLIIHDTATAGAFQREFEKLVGVN